MSNIYEFGKAAEQTIVLNSGVFSEKVDAKHQESYGESGAAKTKITAEKILRSSLIQESDADISNNVLLVGKVQSGKTSNLESLVGLAFDNNFNLVVIYGGTDNTLLSQTVSRFRKTFDIPSDNEDVEVFEDGNTPALFTTKGTDDFTICDLDEELLLSFLEDGIPVILVSIKLPIRINQLNEILSSTKFDGLRALIIDDEGDQASLNNVKDKNSEASRTYAAIRDMKKILGNPLYYAVTATPQANIFLDELSALQPGSIHMLQPAPGYCGAEVFHINENDLIAPVEDDMENALENNQSPDSLKKAIVHFIIASAIALDRDIRTSDMVVHVHRIVKEHSKIYSWVVNYIDGLTDVVEDAIGGDDEVANAIFGPVLVGQFSQKIQSKYQLNLPFYKRLEEVLSKCGVVLQNGPGKQTNKTTMRKRHKIYIGAQLLERGITFKKLLTTYFTRWAKSGGNMDTNLQRARWFGYREDYLDICKLFIPNEILKEFTTLAEMEDDLWDQFESVESGDLPLQEIVILAENTKQRPTRKSVVNYFSISTTAWIKQSIGCFDTIQLTKNNTEVDSFLAELNFSPVSYCRTDGEINCEEVFVNGHQVAELFNCLDGIFGESSFRQTEIVKLLKGVSTVSVIKMFMGNERTRSFWTGLNGPQNKIKALQQGGDKSKKKYKGDRYVYNDSVPATLQIYRVVPMHGDKIQELDNTQYMFALHLRDKRRKGYMRK